MKMVYAHSPNNDGYSHDLVEHLTCVAKMAAEFAGKFGAADLGYWAGLWHDLGKFHPDFQAYLASPTARRGPDHSSAGSLLAQGSSLPIAFLVAGHHGGLPSRIGLQERLREKATKPAMSEALARARQCIETIEPKTSLEMALPEFLRGKTRTTHEKAQLLQRFELFMRMVFSTLVDADFLDTEHHFEPTRSQQRGHSVGLDELWQRLEAAQAAFGNPPQGTLNILRHEIYEACVQRAQDAPGVFSLTVPTGGGKTRSGMAFALKHAMVHGLDRVIVAIPYTSIIEQTADVYRNIFGETCVLEHHSAVITDHEACDPLSYHEVWSRLASENWDAPIVVTTTVQLFESLFARRPSTCRKLHNVTHSVLVLDEVQTLPPKLLVPILDVLQDLVEHYRVSVVLCTATQPALQDSPYLKGLRDIREIVPDPSRYFQP